MRELSRVVNWSSPKTFRMKKVNSPSCLIYWRVAVNLLRYISQDQRAELRTWTYTPAGVEPTPPLNLIPAGAEEEKDDMEDVFLDL